MTYCDDGNTRDGDGCSAICSEECGYLCAVRADGTRGDECSTRSLLLDRLLSVCLCRLFLSLSLSLSLSLGMFLSQAPSHGDLIFRCLCLSLSLFLMK